MLDADKNSWRRSLTALAVLKVQIRRQGDERIHTDSGDYRLYAGPVYRSRGGGAIDAWGYVGRGLSTPAYIICRQTCSTESGGD